MSRSFLAAIAVAAFALAGCAAPSQRGYRAPIVDRSVPAAGVADNTPTRQNTAPGAEAVVAPAPGEKDWRPQVYRVQPGDTLYSIAFNFGFDYHDLAELNGIPNPALIHVGQEIRLFPVAGAAARTAEVRPSQPEIKTQPLAVKLPYSQQAVAQIENVPAPKADVRPIEAKPPRAEVVVTAGVAPGDIPVQWEMPASGKVVGGFSEADNRKGVDIAGKLGQPIYASAAGKVVYSGGGLRGYGKLIIIKHNNTYLSAYAHNDKLLVKEGQMVAKGQMVAQMGSTDADRVMLHFEIRKLGKPVDPAKYLVFPKS